MEIKTPRLKLIFLVIVELVAASTAVIFIRVCPEHPVIISNYRISWAALVLFPVWYRNFRKGTVQYTKWQLKGICASGFFLALHMLTWSYAAKWTTAANASLLVNLQPIVTPFIAFFLVSEVITKGEIIGTFITLLGVFLICGFDFNFSPVYFKGDILSIISMVFASAYVVIARKYRKHIQLINYVVPLYAFAGLVMSSYSLITGVSFKIHTLDGFFWILMLMLIPTIIGHSILNWMMKYIRSQIASLILITQFVISAILGFIVLNENPNLFFYIGAIIVVTGVAIAVLGVNKKKKKITKKCNKEINKHPNPAIRNRTILRKIIINSTFGA